MCSARSQHFLSLTDIVCNADKRIREIRKFCGLLDDGQSLMRAVTQLNLSASAYHRTPKLARAIADLVGVTRSSSRIWRRRCTFDWLKIMHSTM